jgi:Fe-S-cluster-containing hydrogenase component 2
MKFIKPDPTKCEKAYACVKKCAQTFFKTDQPEFSAIQVCERDGKIEINVCNQCGQCIAICPVQALYRNSAGTVMVKKDVCVGCFMCVGFCPTLSMRRAPGQKVPFKCVACGACVKACPHAALTLVEADHSGLPA